MKNNLTNKPTNAVKPLLSSRGFALIATISILSLIALISLALLSLATTKTKVSSYSNHLNIARDNARLALEIAIGQLQKYTGPDQRVTARADITDKDWTNLTPQVANPYYHLAWDVSGSEIDYTANWKGYHTNNRTLGHNRPISYGSAGAVFEWADFAKGVNNTYLRRPGMKPGHDFKSKLPAVLVSGNEFFDDFTNGKGDWLGMKDYPKGYVTANTSLAGMPSVEIIPSESIMVPGVSSTAKGSLDTGVVNTAVKVEVPIVEITGSSEGSSYAYWIGDESLKSRINLESVKEVAGKIAQRSPVLSRFQSKIADDKVGKDSVGKRMSTPTLALNSSSTTKGFHYSPDVTTTSESLVVDVRNGGFKQDFTFSLYNPDSLSPVELRDGSIPVDMPQVNGQTNPWTHIWSPGAGLLPIIAKWRNLAREPVQEGLAIKTYAHNGLGLYPVMSQVQLGQHLAFKKEDSDTAFSVYMGVFPSVTLWNPYNVPLHLNHDIDLALVRRALSLEGQNNKLITDYDLQNLVTGSVEHFDVKWIHAYQRPLRVDPATGDFKRISDDRWSGWYLTMKLKVTDGPKDLIIPPGETMVFSAQETTIEDTPMNATVEKRISVELKPGWNPGKGVLTRMDDRKHLLTDFGVVPPKVRIVQPLVSGNLIWQLNGHGSAGAKNLIENAATHRGKGWIPNSVRWSVWSRLDAVAQSTSSFFTAPATTLQNLDALGSFPGLLVKHGLRMGDDALLTPDSAVHEDQKDLSFPYVAGYNPAALSHTGFGDSNRTGVSGEAVVISPSLMGGVFDFQSSEEIYPVQTKGALERESATPIGIGYKNGDKMILMNRPFALPTTVKNGASASITSFSQLNNSQFLKGQRQLFTSGSTSIMAALSSSNIPAFPIGNSLGNPKLDLHHDDKRDESAIPKHQYAAFLGSIGKVLYSPRPAWLVSSMEMDYSYLLNEYLYDHYFFSTIPQDEAKYTANDLLVNSRLVPDAEVKTDHDKLKSIDVAKHLTLVGGFNVNSTSVPAWEMLLASSLGGDRGDTPSSDKTAAFSNKKASGEKNDKAVSAREVDTNQALDSDFYMTLSTEDGTDVGKKLNKAEIRRLAEAIVSEVKRRGPFPSISAFVNRANFLEDMARPNPNEFIGASIGITGYDFEDKSALKIKTMESQAIVDARYSGAIQSALDRIDVNETLDKLGELDSRPIDKSGFAEKTNYGTILPAKGALRKTTNSHLPGYLKQSDVLAQIAPVITVRGDTFTIRCFGASGKDANGQPIAKAVCEAVVQRGKEFVDPDANAYDIPVKVAAARNIATTTDLVDSNKEFGRKYKIVSFKWLSQKEVSEMTISDVK